MVSLADSVGLALIVSCTDFDMAEEPCPAKSRIQFVLERRVTMPTLTSNLRPLIMLALGSRS
jgi:hypothetical protein